MTPEIDQSSKYVIVEDWTKWQPTILHLYLDEGKTIEEVREHMAQTHEFFATIPMYKKKLAEWKAFKNLRASEVVQVLRLKRDRDAAGKASIFFIRGKQVDPGSLKSYISRNSSVLAQVGSSQSPDPEALGDVVAKSPQRVSSSPERGSSLTSLLKLPEMTKSNPNLASRDDHNSHEKHILEGLRAYTDQCFDTGLWQWTQDYCWNTKGHQGPTELLNALLDRCMTAALSVSRQVVPVAVRQALDTPFTMLVRVFRNPPPSMIPRIVSVAHRLHMLGRPEVQAILLQFCCDLAVSLYGREDHPLAVFWDGMVNVPQDEQHEITERVLSQCLADYKARLGSHHPLTTEVYLLHLDFVGRTKPLQARSDSLSELLSDIESKAPHSPFLGLLRLEHALSICKLAMEQGRLDSAEKSLTELRPDGLTAKDESFRCAWLGYVQWCRGKIPEAERSYKDSVREAQHTGSLDCLCEALFQLETFFLRTGRPLEGEWVRAERLQALRRLDSIIWTYRDRPAELQGSEPGPSVTVVRVGSGASSAKWRPSAFARVTELFGASGSGSGAADGT
ncbi:hypothetical protein F4778DRAFT_713321 [Xylariomycetidae sp. FL2044]|nr:hypothetical protein F4778DRAFT_713321 [Xylariomycetidae sp. FL2044]